jgi:hypothetical protein
MAYEDKSPLSPYTDEILETILLDDGATYSANKFLEEIKLFRKALRYCFSQDGDDNCWMDWRHLLLRFLPEYTPLRDDVRLDVNQLENCKAFIKCWQRDENWECLGGDKGSTVPARSIGTLDCLKDK